MRRQSFALVRKPPLSVETRPPGNLPAQPTPLIGREEEVATALQLLTQKDGRLLTLAGPGGVGKTHLGLQVASSLLTEFQDGVYFVSLASITSPDLVYPAIAQALGVRPAGGQALLKKLASHLQEKRVLLMLDNFEQVMDAASQVADLLSACPRLKVLVTSRDVLHIRGEAVLDVPPLALPDDRDELPDAGHLRRYAAVVLFVDRSQAVNPDFRLTETNGRNVVEICARLDGLPLAIELAATHSRLLPPRALLARLDRPLRFLVGGARDLPARQRTLRDTLEWSYNLLDDAEQRIFTRMAVFAGSCSLAAAEAVVSHDVVNGLGSLVGKSLLRRVDQGDAEPRLAMLATIREYAVERLEAGDEAWTVRKRHAAYYLAVAEDARPHPGGQDEATWLDYLQQEHDNFRAALHWAIESRQAGIGLRLAGALLDFWQLRGYWTEARQQLEQMLALPESLAPALRAHRARVISGAGRFAWFQYDFERARSLYNQGLAIYKEIGDSLAAADVLKDLGFLEYQRGDVASARAYYEESLAIFGALGNRAGLADTLRRLGTLSTYEGDYDAARAFLVQSLAIHEELGDKTGITFAANNLGEVARLEGNYKLARTYYEQSLKFLRSVKATNFIANVLNNLGHVAHHAGDTRQAVRCFLESLSLKQELGDKPGMAAALSGLGTTLAGAVGGPGQYDLSARLLAVSEATFEAASVHMAAADRREHEQGAAQALAHLGRKRFDQVQAQGRAMPLEQAVTLARKHLTTARRVPTGASPTSYPAGLSEREVEVLRLIAGGLTDAEIAARLHISAHTVNAHCRSIYSKLGTSSRTSAARYAMEHGLL